MKADPLRLLGVGVLVAAAVTAPVFLVPRVLTAAAGPEVELITLLKHAEAAGLELAVPDAGTLYSSRVRYQRLQVSVDAPARTARVNCTLDFTGRLGETTVSSLGLERVTFRYGEAGWAPDPSPAPVLMQVVGALEARRAALESGDPAALAALAPPRPDGGAAPERLGAVLAVQERRYRATGWFIRSEREGVTVTEDFRLQGHTPDRPVDERGTVRLVVKPGGEFCFPHGLM